MPKYYKCVAFFNCINRGWSEVYYGDFETVLPPATSGNPNNNDSIFAVNQFFKSQLLPKRAQISGRPVTIIGTRVSKVKPLKGGKPDYKNMPTVNQQADSDNPPSTLVVTLFDATGSLKHQLHCRGIWDEIDTQGGQLNTTAAFDTKFADFATAVTAPPWGWFTRAGENVQPIDTYAVAQNGSVNFTLGAPLFTNDVVGTTQTVRVSSLNYGKSALNGQLTVKVDGTDSCTTKTRFSVVPFLEEGQMRWNPPVFVRNAVCEATKIGNRDTGGSLFLGRGRASPKVHY